jgi:hypothetical protein
MSKTVISHASLGEILNDDIISEYNSHEDNIKGNHMKNEWNGMGVKNLPQCGYFHWQKSEKGKTPGWLSGALGFLNWHNMKTVTKITIYHIKDMHISVDRQAKHKSCLIITLWGTEPKARPLQPQRSQLVCKITSDISQRYHS